MKYGSCRAALALLGGVSGCGGSEFARGLDHCASAYALPDTNAHSHSGRFVG